MLTSSEDFHAATLLSPSDTAVTFVRGVAQRAKLASAADFVLLGCSIKLMQQVKVLGSFQGKLLGVVQGPYAVFVHWDQMSVL